VCIEGASSQETGLDEKSVAKPSTGMTRCVIRGGAHAEGLRCEGMRRSALGRFYDREVLGRVLDRGMAAVGPLRARLLAAARGRVLEVGFGTGANLPYFPEAVTSLVAVEPSEGLAEVAIRRLRRWDRPWEVVVASASRPLPLDAGSFDVAVITFVLCSARHGPELLAETRRLLRPGAPLLIAEHVAAAPGALRLLQHAVRPLWRRALGGCDPAYDARATLERAGFDTSALAETRLPLPPPVQTGLVGIARAGEPPPEIC
jgi:SAM-dependent methyltransferase